MERDMRAPYDIPFGYAEPLTGDHGRATSAAAVIPPFLARRREPVETLWTYRADRPRRFLVLPDGRADLILRFRIENERVSGPVTPLLVGPSTVAHTVPVNVGDAFIGARLRPGRLCWLDGAATLSDRSLIGPEAITRVPSFEEVVNAARDAWALMEGFTEMLSTLPTGRRDAEVDAALDRLHLTGGRTAPSELADSLGVGARRLLRLFVTHVGLPPSSYSAVLRFQRAVRLRRRGLGIADTAHEAGYADQPHMTRAFRRHGGFTPACMADAELGWMPIGEGRTMEGERLI